MSASRLNKFCELKDFREPARIAAIRRIESEHCREWPDYPAGREHRRSWEYAQLLTGLEGLGAVNSDSLVLSAGGGADRACFDLTTRARLVFAADLYAGSAAAVMLTEPERIGGTAYDRNRLIVQHMALNDLRFEDETFDVVYSLGVCGGLATAGGRMAELRRVCRAGGIVMLSIDVAVEGTPHPDGPLTRDDAIQLYTHQPALECVDAVDWSVDAETLAEARPMQRVLEDLERGHNEYPHLLLEEHGCKFTSLSLFLRKKTAHD